jgi:hypothetical protein
MHGVSKNLQHTSILCENRAPGHQETATKDNIMGGSNRVGGRAPAGDYERGRANNIKISTPKTSFSSIASSPPTTLPQTLESPIIADTGATGHFLTSDAPYYDQKAAQPGISVLLPDGSQLQSTHKAQIRLAQLPAQACEAHIFPKLASGSLILIEKLCDHCHTTVFDATTVTVRHRDQIILQGKRSPITKLWSLDLPTAPATPAMNALVQNLNLADRIAFFHAAMFSPTLSTWCSVIDTGHLTTWPELTSAQV